jgi:protein-disulfide isomerase
MREKINVALGTLILAGLLFWVGTLVVDAVKNRPVVSSNEITAQSNSTDASQKSAKVTVVEFGDYQCPACGLAADAFERIRTDYAANPDVDVQFLHFPLPSHQHAVIAAEAAEAARAQGKFWEMHNMLYERQSEWSGQADPLGQFTVYANQLDLDVAQFKIDIQTQKYVSLVEQDYNQGQVLEVNATPTFFINDKKVVGVMSYSDFKKEIEDALAGIK